MIPLLSAVVIGTFVYLWSARPAYALLCDSRVHQPITLVVAEVKNQELQCDEMRVSNTFQTLLILKGYTGQYVEIMTPTRGQCPIKTVPGEIRLEQPDPVGAPTLPKFEVGKRYLLSLELSQDTNVNRRYLVPVCKRIAIEVAGLHDTKIPAYTLNEWLEPLWKPRSVLILPFLFARFYDLPIEVLVPLVESVLVVLIVYGLVAYILMRLLRLIRSLLIKMIVNSTTHDSHTR